MRVRSLGPLLLVLVLFAAAGACSADRMAPRDCGMLVDHVTELELAARGFRDPALAARRKEEIRQTLSDELGRCTRIAHDHAHIACVLDARTRDELWTRCLPGERGP